MVSKARLDFPEPERPVMQIRRCLGRRTVMSFRLCSRAPWTTSSSGIRISIAGCPDANACSFRGGPGAAPGPVVGMLHEPGADRVVQDVADRSLEVPLVADDPGAVAVAEEVA